MESGISPVEFLLIYVGIIVQANSRYRHFLRAGAENEDAQLSALQSSWIRNDPHVLAEAQEHHEGLAR